MGIGKAAGERCAASMKSCTTRLGKAKCCNATFDWSDPSAKADVAAYTQVAKEATPGKLYFLSTDEILNITYDGLWSENLKDVMPLFLPAECDNTADRLAISK